jgi:hypothetical protein
MFPKRRSHTFVGMSLFEPWSVLYFYSKDFLLAFGLVNVVLFLVVGAWGQDAGKLVEPGSPSICYKLDSSGQLLPLESQVVHVGRKFHAWGFSGVTMIYQVEGKKSKMRLKAEGKPEFVVRLEGKLDPLETVQFYRFDEIDGSRVVPVGDFNALGQMSNLQWVDATVDFNAIKYGASSYKLIPIPALIAGEYCLVVRVATEPQSKSPAFCFGVDVAGN